MTDNRIPDNDYIRIPDGGEPEAARYRGGHATEIVRMDQMGSEMAARSHPRWGLAVLLRDWLDDDGVVGFPNYRDGDSDLIVVPADEDDLRTLEEYGCDEEGGAR